MVQNAKERWSGYGLKQYYSQFDEEKYITDYFKEYIGSFIDIGAYHPYNLSNTRRLYEMGWSGVIIEPSPKCFKLFKDEYKDEPKMKLFNCAISDHNREMKFYDSNGDAISTLDIDSTKKWTGSNFTEITVDCMSPDTLFDKIGYNFDFMNIDTEGLNVKILSLMPDTILNNLKAICIEYDGGKDQIIQKLNKFGFRVILENMENLILVK